MRSEAEMVAFSQLMATVCTSHPRLDNLCGCPDRAKYRIAKRGKRRWSGRLRIFVLHVFCLPRADR